MLKSLNKLIKGLLIYIGQWWRFFGRILVSIGYVIAGYGKSPYLVVARIIETCLRSALIQIDVDSIKPSHPLYISFIVHVRSAFSNKIDWSYLHLELMLQMGCGFNDITHSYIGTSGKDSIYQIDITRTALSNLEMGRTEQPPDLFEERDTEWRLNRALELAKSTDLTPELLEKNLGITDYHAKLLYNQITKSEALPKHPKGKLMN